MAQLIKSLPTMQETWFLSLVGLGRSPGEGKENTPVFWPEDFHGLFSLWGRKESDKTKQLSLSLFTEVSICIIYDPAIPLL